MWKWGAAASLLTTLALLREEGILPRTPLRVQLLGGDISEDALTNAGAIMKVIADEVWKQGIFIQYVFGKWDVKDAAMTTKLLAEWVTHCHQCQFHLVSIASFSGYLHDKIEKVRERLGEVFRWCDTRQNSFVLWTEPNTKKSQRMMTNVIKYVSDAANWLKQLVGLGDRLYSTEARVTLPLAPANDRRVTLRILRAQ